MISLLSPILTTESSSCTPPIIPLFLRDCVRYVMQFTSIRTTLSMFLVCRNWYHAMDRVVFLGDTFYYFPTMFGDEIIRRRNLPACLSGSLSLLQADDVRWGYAEAMVLKVMDTLVQGVECFPPSLKLLCLRESYQITD
eukprot:PhF_6_TR4345/c0_g1_i2/m.5858